MKKAYYTTVHTDKHDVLLVPIRIGIVETYCKGYDAKDKKLRCTTFDGYYFNSELKQFINK